MKSLSNYILDRTVSENFAGFLNTVKDIVTGKRSAEKKAERERLEKEEIEKRSSDMRKWKRKFFDAVGSGTEDFTILAIDYKVSDITARWTASGMKAWTEYTAIYICGKNSANDVEDAFQSDKDAVMSQWQYLNLDNKKFTVKYAPLYIQNGRETWGSIRETYPMIHLFDIEDVRINDSEDIRVLSDSLKKQKSNWMANYLIKELDKKLQ